MTTSLHPLCRGRTAKGIGGLALAFFFIKGLIWLAVIAGGYSFVAPATAP